ncbi:MAG: type 4a pilus biogenesis protein PilO [Acidimicrobiales bacterium]|jgi:Tfp pilus assembly protein PilO
MNSLRGFNFDLLKSKVVLVVTGLVIILLVVWWFAWMTPESNKLSTVQAQVSSDQTTLTQLNLELASLKAEKKLVLRELPYLKKVQTAIPPTEDPPGIVDSLNNLATATNCDLLSVTPADYPSPSGVPGLSDIGVSFTVTGGHRNIFQFLKGFYGMGRLMTINTINLGAAGANPNILAVNDGMQYSMNISAVAYTTYVTPGAAT